VHPVSMSRAGRLPFACAVALMLSLAACGEAPAEQPASPSKSAAPSTTTPAAQGVQALIVASVIAVGPRRFPIGILVAGTPVADATVHVRAYAASAGAVTLKAESDAPFRGDGLEGRGLYVAHLDLDTPGRWLAQITVQRAGSRPATVNQPFQVVERTLVPMVGQPAPRSNSPTVADVPDASYIDSGVPPDDMHAVSIATAIAQHRPTLVVFATPAFCSSVTCGPQVHAVQALEPAYRDRLTFVHVEVYQNFKPDPSRRQLSPTMLEWHLETEPWVFLIDSAGILRAEFESAAATDELREALDRLLAS
jgi:hypothetical protein